MAKGTDKIEYKYLDVDRKTFVKDQAELTRDKIGGLIRAIPNWKYNQCLFAASREHFTELEAILLCRRLSG